MGNIIQHSSGKMDLSYNSRDSFDVAGLNGYVLQECYIPEEILIHILSYLDPEELVFNCRRVCKVWCNVIDLEVLRVKCVKEKRDLKKLNEFPWFVLFWLLKKDFLDRNLIKNGCGQEQLTHWEILSSGGNQWAVEQPPHGTPDFPESMSEEIIKINSAFVTSYYSCSKQQLIDLKAEGAIPYFMQKFHPQITVSEWYRYVGRFDCGSVYELKVRLLDEEKYVLEEFEITKNVGGNLGSEWQQVKHVFENDTSDVRFIEFYHSGMDSQFWQGHYGSKMTGASVVLSVP